MKFCYCDESGTGDEPIAVMVGVIVDSQRMHITKEDWETLLTSLSKIVKKPIKELHVRDFYSGNSIWRDIDGPERAKIIIAVLEWLVDRKHNIVLSAIEKEKYFFLQKKSDIPREINTIWKALGLHILLSIQKSHQVLEKNKGNTIFIFDNEERERMRFTGLIKNPPPWSDSYYNKKPENKRLNQIIDVPYFGDSKEVGLIQIADFIAYFVRRYIEIKEDLIPPRYSDEGNRLEDYIALISERCLESKYTYLKKGRCSCSELFYSICPDTIKTLGK